MLIERSGELPQPIGGIRTLALAEIRRENDVLRACQMNTRKNLVPGGELIIRRLAAVREPCSRVKDILLQSGIRFRDRQRDMRHQ